MALARFIRQGQRSWWKTHAVVRLNRWTPQPELRRLIRRLCVWRPLSAEELAQILNRAKTYLQSTYIGPMVRAGELEYTNPEKPSDPSQKYRAIDDPVEAP